MLILFILICVFIFLIYSIYINISDKSVDLEKMMKKYKIKNYTIYNDHVDIHQNLDLSNLNLYDIPFKINRIEGNLDLSNNNIKYLSDNFPNYIHGNLDLSNNKISIFSYCVSGIEYRSISLVGNPICDIPTYVYTYYNSLTTSILIDNNRRKIIKRKKIFKKFIY